MFNGKMEFVKEYLDKIGARYHEIEMNGLKQIYIFEKETYDKVHENPKKYKDLYVSYLRLSKHDDEDRFYTRMDGITGYKSDKTIKKIIENLTGI